MSSTFQYDISEKKGYAEVALRGKLLSTFDGKPLVEALASNIQDRNKFLVDLKGLDFMSSEGFNILLQLLTKARNAGGDAVIVNLSTELKQLFIVTKLNHIFTTANTKKEAVAILMQ